MQSLVLEVAVGLALMFYITATLVNGLAEGATRLLNTRSKMLWAALERLVTTSAQSPSTLGAPLIFKSLVPRGPDSRPPALKSPAIADPAPTAARSAADLLTELAGTPSIRAVDYVTGTASRLFQDKTKVANIPGAVFATALLELATTKASGQDMKGKLGALATAYAGTPLGEYLTTIAEHADDDVDRVTQQISTWFDQQMGRLTETYRKNVKYVLACLGLIVALFCNIDAVGAAQGLATNAQVRQVVSATAGDITKADVIADCTTTQQDPTGKVIDCGLQKLAGFSATGVVVPLTPGWPGQWARTWSWDTAVIHLVGIGVTTGAIALGGPMWFDFLMLLTGRKRT